MSEQRPASEAELLTKSRMVALGEIAAGIAHEINNPLAILKQCVSLIEDYIKRGQVPEVQRARLVEKAIVTIDRIAALTKALLIFSREDNRDPFVMGSVRRLVEEAKERQASLLEQIGVKIDDGGTPADFEVECREQQLVEVLSNLLANACDAVADTKGPAITIEVRATKAHKEIIVRDNGGGIKPAIATRIFDPFFSTKTIGHVGLGLSIVKELVRSLGGQIGFYSEPGKTEFIVEFPR